jgi:hypothetical protein
LALTGELWAKSANMESLGAWIRAPRLVHKRQGGDRDPPKLPRMKCRGRATAAEWRQKPLRACRGHEVPRLVNRGRGATETSLPPAAVDLPRLSNRENGNRGRATLRIPEGILVIFGPPISIPSRSFQNQTSPARNITASFHLGSLLHTSPTHPLQPTKIPPFPKIQTHQSHLFSIAIITSPFEQEEG